MKCKTTVIGKAAMLLTGLMGVAGAQAAQPETTYDTAVTNAGTTLIVGSGITNQHFAVTRSMGIEVGLQSRVVCQAFTDETNNGGTGVYDHPSRAPCNLFGLGNLRVPWQFDWSINVDYNNTTNLKLGGLRYELLVDTDPSDEVNFVSLGDPVNDPVTGATYLDHSFGNNNTTSVDDQSASDATTYAALVQTNNLVQQSWNYGYLPPTCPPNVSLPQCVGADLTGPGTFDIKLSVYQTALTKEQCRKGGWKNLTDAAGNPFKNQGGCISYTVPSKPLGSVTIQVIQQ